MQPMLTAAWMMVMVVVSNALDLLPTAVVPTPQRTKAPAEVVVPEYAQTLYKATDYSTVMNTLVPLWPTHATKFHDTVTTTVINQTISTSTAEFATLINTTVLYHSTPTATHSLEAAMTSYETLEFQHQSVIYTDLKNNSITHTTLQDNGLPFI
ncbi:uncharacterized protein LOC123520025 [Portunus trituberculatus]|nr:uncharacterized protein LOC123520025 [Portunus trituberculatus]